MGKAGGEGGEAGPPMSVPPAAPWRPRRRRGGRRCCRCPARSLARVHITQCQVAASPLVPPPAPPRCPRPLLCFLPAAGPAGLQPPPPSPCSGVTFAGRPRLGKESGQGVAAGRGRALPRHPPLASERGPRTRTPAPLWQACLVGWVKPQCVHTERRGAVERRSGLAEEHADQAPATQGNSELPGTALRISKNQGDGRNTGKGGLFPVHTHTHTQPLAGTADTHLPSLLLRVILHPLGAASAGRALESKADPHTCPSG
ncbi:uncharacterized protein LOC112624346 [Theropithecus gelada]|uniref:uncharacterized protein LOC112624346 n=1 Tax=Theropithecus gelada TaxID=9565 RepID=UPI000DC187CD|nr:uncharacterized protein LOC112624346 [Theropithecus gelada]